ncbi:metal-dependent hydrolase [Bailinhaonella thermotolerans]|uniref:Metal-dependent hydrolase n=1 Tax=Bailinhaonella thermotolerans TaxID=1070861 RepID=A0A3A4AWE2_9ACTN|nr:metal-dependent hydrolase [Bailinhaonella thermotolerans]RJL34225.1 metal-dependent hydrolase [Bailinhaonella thermotolerans]
MMGHTHTLTGAVAWLGATPLLAAAGFPLGPAEVVAGGLICAGAAMLPDLDHPSATIAQTYGPVTWVLSRVVNWASGGHRKATHSLLFAAAAGIGAQALADRTELGRNILIFLMIGLALRGLGVGIPRKRIASAFVNAGLTLGTMAALATFDLRYDWLGAAIALGCLAHIAGDCFTEKGCPIFWPVKTRFALPFGLGIDTGGKIEMRLLTPLFTVAAAGLLVFRLVPLT